MNSIIITDDFRFIQLPMNCVVNIRNIAPEAVKILFDSSTKDQVQFRINENENHFQALAGKDYTNNNFPRKYTKGDVLIYCCFFKTKKDNHENKDDKDFLMYKLIGIA